MFAAQHGGPQPEDSLITFAASSASSSNQKASAMKVIQKNNKIDELSISLLHTKVEKTVLLR
jgi:hypothetical protein